MADDAGGAGRRSVNSDESQRAAARYHAERMARALACALMLSLGVSHVAGAQDAPVEGGASASTAPASTATAPATDETEARALFAAGSSAFDAGRFGDALRDFARAYALSDRPAFLYNIAIAYEHLGRMQLALEHYTKYRDALPDAENRGEVDERIRRLTPLAEEEAQAEAEAREREQSARHVGPWPWVVVATGGALLVAGVIVHVAGQVDAMHVESPSEPLPRWADVMDAAARAPTLMNTGIVLGAVGLSALVGGLVWAFVGAKRTAEEPIAVEVTLFGASVRGRF